jgi:uncharacterized protein (DUF983 family)
VNLLLEKVHKFRFDEVVSERINIFFSILSNSCPKCKHRKIVNVKGVLSDSCPSCGLLLKREDGFMLGALPVNYALIFTFWVLPILIFWWNGVISENIMWGSLLGGILVLPFLLVRFSRLLWIAMYFAILPYTLDEKE